MFQKYGMGSMNIHSFEFKIRDKFRDDMQAVDLWRHLVVHEEDVRTASWILPIDFLFIDSEHAIGDALGEYVKFRPHFSPKAIIGFHDSVTCFGVRTAIDIITRMDNLKFLAKSEAGGMGIEFYEFVGRDLNKKFKIVDE